MVFLVLLLFYPLSRAHTEEKTILETTVQNPAVTFNQTGPNLSEVQQSGSICITVNNLRNGEGYLGIALFRSEEGFPEKSELAYALTGVELNGRNPEIVLDNIPFGTYAVCVLHDENRNMEMDKNWIGIPKEGFGTSNNPKIRFGPPEFDESGFVLDKETISMEITMKYL